MDSTATIASMATLHIRSLDAEVKERLRVRAAQHGRSMEAEARQILEDATLPRMPEKHLYLRVRELVEQYGPMELKLPTRDAGREPPDFS